MPPASEQVINKPLTGEELQLILIKDFTEALKKNCLLNGVTAFGQLSYEITYRLHFNNTAFPEASHTITSTPPPPLDEVPITAETVTAEELHRDIASPNQARVEFGIPVPIVTRQEGKAVEKTAQYPPDAVKPTPHKTTDHTSQTIRDLKDKKEKRKGK